MNFERGRDIKDTVKIGRKANAFRVRTIAVRGEIPGVWQESASKEHKRINPSNVLQFLIFGDDLKLILSMMEKQGISKELDWHIKSLIIKKHQENIERAIEVNGHPGSVNYDTGRVRIIHINFETRFKSIYPVDKHLLLPKTLGKDILYRGKLYRIKNEF